MWQFSGRDPLPKRKMSAEDLQKAADKVLTEFGKTAKLRGFRPGHIPLSVLRQRYNASAWGEAVDKAINADLQNYVNDKKLRLAAQPRVDFAGYNIGNDVEYSMEFDVLPGMPEIDLGKIKIFEGGLWY